MDPQREGPGHLAGQHGAPFVKPGDLQGTPKGPTAAVPLRGCFAKGHFAGKFWAAQESATGALPGAPWLGLGVGLSVQ